MTTNETLQRTARETLEFILDTSPDAPLLFSLVSGLTQFAYHVGEERAKREGEASKPAAQSELPFPPKTDGYL